MLVYTFNRSSQFELFEFLKGNDDAFYPLFSQSVNLDEYSLKLHNKADRYECWSGDELIGLLAVYTNQETNTAYIPYLCVTHKMSSLGIAHKLLSHFLESTNAFKVILECRRNNERAFAFYLKNGFVISDVAQEKYQMILHLK